MICKCEARQVGVPPCAVCELGAEIQTLKQEVSHWKHEATISKDQLAEAMAHGKTLGEECVILQSKLDNADAAIQDTRRRVGALLDGTAKLGGFHTHDEELADIHRCLGLPSIQRSVPDTTPRGVLNEIAKILFGGSAALTEFQRGTKAYRLQSAVDQAHQIIQRALTEKAPTMVDSKPSTVNHDMPCVTCGNPTPHIFCAQTAKDSKS